MNHNKGILSNTWSTANTSAIAKLAAINTTRDSYGANTFIVAATDATIIIK